MAEILEPVQCAHEGAKGLKALRGEGRRGSRSLSANTRQFLLEKLLPFKTLELFLEALVAARIADALVEPVRVLPGLV